MHACSNLMCPLSGGGEQWEGKDGSSNLPRPPVASPKLNEEGGAWWIHST